MTHRLQDLIGLTCSTCPPGWQPELNYVLKSIKESMPPDRHQEYSAVSGDIFKAFEKGFAAVSQYDADMSGTTVTEAEQVRNMTRNLFLNKRGDGWRDRTMEDLAAELGVMLPQDTFKPMP